MKEIQIQCKENICKDLFLTYLDCEYLLYMIKDICKDSHPISLQELKKYKELNDKLFKKLEETKKQFLNKDNFEIKSKEESKNISFNPFDENPYS